ncbi:hypothetical protein YC2023_006919 [Brassica napus]
MKKRVLVFTKSPDLGSFLEEPSSWRSTKRKHMMCILRVVDNHVPSTSTVNPAEKYIQVISDDDHEFWFIGFLN